MLERKIRIGRWSVRFFFAEDSYDEDAVYNALYDIDAPYSVMLRAKRIMEEADYNCGFTFGNPELRMAVVVVGPSSSADEFLNTFSHEVDHLSDIIAESLGIKQEREGTSYLTGGTTMALAEVVCYLGCSHCRRVK